MTESKIQAECYKWFNNTYCLKFQNPRGVMWSTPNESASVVTGVLKQFNIPEKQISAIRMRINQKMKRMGMRSGVADTDVILPDGGRFFVEFKTATGRQSKAQKEFQETVESLGNEYFIIRSVEEFKALIENKLA